MRKGLNSKSPLCNSRVEGFRGLGLGFRTQGLSVKLPLSPFITSIKLPYTTPRTLNPNPLYNPLLVAWTIARMGRKHGQKAVAPKALFRAFGLQGVVFRDEAFRI